ncbi:MAG: succinate dehydrogenase iron-sulfur subunit [Candidatus Hydrothermales bacterium]
MKIKVAIKRYVPEINKEGFEIFEIDYEEGMTVLDALLKIKENFDSTLAFRYSCRMGICGSCGMIINDKPDLACHTQVKEVAKKGVIKVEPIPNLLLIKDLVPDFTSIFENYKKIKPYLIRKDEKEQENPTREYTQTPDELLEYLQFSYCIQCGLCISSCPVSSSDEFFFQPLVLAQAYRFSADKRDEGVLERLNAVTKDHGVFNCHFAGGCSMACPKGVDPALAIQMLKRLVLKKSLGLLKERKGREVVPPYPEGPNRDKIPKAPPKTVE